MVHTNIFFAALFVLRKAVFQIILLECILLAVEFLTDSSTGLIGGKLVARGILVYSMHRSIMFPDEDTGSFLKLGSSKPNKGFWIAYLVIMLSIISFGLLVIFSFLRPSVDQGNISSDIATLIAFAVMGLMALAVLSLWGTAIPAAVANREAGFSKAFQRAKSTFTPVLTGLVFGAGIYSILMVGLIVVIEINFGIAPLNPENLSVISGIYSVIIWPLTWYNTALVVSVLTRAYQNYEQQMHLSESSNGS